MLKFYKEITNAKMLKCLIMNCSYEFLTTKYYILCPLKNNTLIKISVLNLLHYWHLVLDGFVIKFYLLKKKRFFIHSL